MAFCDLRWNADGSPTELRGQAEELFARERAREGINAFDERHPQLPSLEIAVRRDGTHVLNNTQVPVLSLFLRKRFLVPQISGVLNILRLMRVRRFCSAGEA